MKRLALLFAVVSSGCGVKLVDPCAGQSGACLGIHVDASATVSHLSKAQIHVTGDAIDVEQAVALQNGASSAELPIAVAVIFPGLAATTPVHVDVLGILDGAHVGQGSLDATIAPAQHASVHLQLGSALPDDGGTDDGAPDLASTDLAGYLPVTIQLSGTGTGTVSGSGISCTGTTCSGLFAPHSVVTLAAAPASNATFSGWSGGGCVGTSTCMITVDVATTLTATFDWKFVPSHVSASAYNTGAANLTGVTSIDTHNLTINGSAPPSGITFVFQSGVAVMSVGTWNVTSSITVTGDAPLVVVAAGGVTFTNGSIIADAHGATPGPGGNATCTAVGTGVPIGGGATGSGSGGEFGGGASAGQLSKGMIYGTKVTDFCAGAAGGGGTHMNNLDNTCAPAGVGGGGGGAIQISSAVSILIHSGRISAGGGGGSPSCAHNNPAPSFGSSSAAPGGGGSGGLIFLEAPMITIGDTGNAIVGANGGGGGGTSGTDTTSPANPGGDATLALGTPGGTGTQGNGGGGAYSPDGVALTNATAPTGTDPYFGGGGGGVGRIWIRTRGTAAATNSTTFSPAPTIDLTL